MTNFLKQHYGAFVCALFFASALAGPFVLTATDHSFTGVFPELVNDQDYYLSRIQEVRDGFFGSGNTYLAEWKHVQALQPQIGEVVIAAILTVGNLPTASILILGAFIFGFIIFIVLYAFGFRLGVPDFWALRAAAFVSFGAFFFDFARPISPQFNFLFWLLTVYGMFAMKEKPSWRWVALQSCAFGVLFYIYPYYWTHIVLACAMLIGVYLIRERARAFALISALAGGFIIAIPYFLSLFSARTLPFYNETYARLGFIETHYPSGFVLVGASVAVILFMGFFLRSARAFSHDVLVSLILLVAGLGAMNQHVITGLNMEFSSHYGLQILAANIFFILASATALTWWPRLAGLSVKVGAVALIVVASAPFVVSPYIYAEKQRGGVHGEYGEITAWLNANAGIEEIVYAESALSQRIPAYTSLNVVYARNANLFFLPQQETLDRFLVQYYGAEVTADFVREHEREIFGVHYINRYNHAALRAKVFSLFGSRSDIPERLPQAEIEAVKARAKEIAQKPLTDYLARYRVQYVILEKEKIPDALPGFEKVFETETYVIFSQPAQQ